MAFKDEVSKTFNQTFWTNYSKEANEILSLENKKEEEKENEKIY